MEGINRYSRELSSDEIADGKHRFEVGGMWDEVGPLQLEFLRGQGLLPADTLVDIGCGPMRGGIHFVRYLDDGNYYGIDINESLITAGIEELRAAGLESKHAHLAVTGDFDAQQFGIKFDYVIAISLFTHLYANHIVRCMKRVREVMAPGTKFYASFFGAPSSGHLEPITHVPRITSHFDSDPFHQSVDELAYMAKVAGLEMAVIGDWGHPRRQQMALFSRSGS